jgi:signal transduction histidine kinase
MLIPLLLGGVAFYFLREPLDYWRRGDQLYDEQAMQEWVREARVGDRSLPELLRDFLDEAKVNSQKLKNASKTAEAEIIYEHEQKRGEIQELLNALCVPATRVYAGQLPLFPFIFRLEVTFDDKLKKQYDERLKFNPIAWDSENPRHPHQYRELAGYDLLGDQGVKVNLQYTLHAYMQKQLKEREDDARRRLVNVWVLVLAFSALVWMFILQRREAARDRQRLVTEQQIQETRQKHLEEELRRQEAERKQEEAERKQLQEELRRQEAEHEKQEAERQALELKSQMFHSIGIMAKSYAHNIKNLLVRPNDLLRRCIEEHPTEADASRMMVEIQQTLVTVTERLQEILQTVQRDPSQFEHVQVDLNAIVRDLHKTWAEQAESKWKMLLEIELHSDPHEKLRSSGDVLTTHHSLLVTGDRSHLQQALENFLFNARDAISEMRNHLRKQARPEGAQSKAPLDDTQRQALIAAAGWKGRVLIRTAVIDNQPVIEIRDNGIGMTPETRAHCTEPHFSTKRNNALYAGLSSGMGLGLSFVQMILQHHGATLEIESEPMKGAAFRVRFPAIR